MSAHFDPEAAAIAAYESDIAASAASDIIRSRLGARSLHEIAAVEPPDWLIPGFIQRSGIHVISSESGTGKTWLALQTMLAGATGMPLLGTTPTSKFDTLFLGADSPDWDLANQLRQLSRATGVNIPKTSESLLLPYGLNMLDAAHIGAMLDYISTHNIGLLVLDVLLYSYHGADENSNTDMARVFHGMKVLRDRAKCAILALHHWKKGADTARGAGTIIQAAEHTYVMRKEDSGAVLLERQKIRGESDWPSMLITLQPNDNGDGLHFVRTNPLPPLVISWFTMTKTLSRTQLLERTKEAGFSSAWLGNQLTALKRDGHLTTDGRGNWTLATK